MNTKMTMSHVLSRIFALEEAAAELYEFYASCFKHNPRANSLFLKMNKEEIGHKNQLLFQKRIVDKTPNLFEDVEVDTSILNDTIDDIKSQINNGKPELIGALDFAIEMENGLFENVYRKTITHKCKELSKLIVILAEESNHIHKLRLLKKSIQG